MNTVKVLVKLALQLAALAASSFVATWTAAATLVNVTEGQGNATSSANPSWDGLSELVLIPGASLIGPSSTTTAIYLGFTGGSTVNVGNMVLYATPRNGSTVVGVTNVTLGASQSPTIHLTSKSVCPVAPSPTSPCIVRLDTVNLALSPLKDYYFAIYFTLDTNNQLIAGMGQSTARGALSGFNLYGDQTRVGVDGALPTFENSDAAPFFVAYVANE
jgi:hypothetical protein